MEVNNRTVTTIDSYPIKNVFVNVSFDLRNESDYEKIKIINWVSYFDRYDDFLKGLIRENRASMSSFQGFPNGENDVHYFRI